MKIVAPAGNRERLEAAIKAGAEEIYMGLKGFGARRAAENFSMEEFLKALDYAHLRGTRIFLTLNTIMMKDEIEFLYPNVKKLYEHGLDAIIVQDLGLAYYIRKNFPEIELHGSTQLSVANHREIQFLESLGFQRVVLPRELSFEEIQSIRENTKIELEVFVSGALCISYSGNCYLSSFLGGRSGNRGMCAQVCRKKYHSSCGGKLEEEKTTFFLSPKDQMYGKEEIQSLKAIGVDSIKIEGRMKEPNYVFSMVDYYKALIEEREAKELASSLFHRGYSKGYFYGSDIELMNPEFSSNLGERLGVLQGRELGLEKPVILGDGLSFLSKDYEKLGGMYLSHISLKDSARQKGGEKCRRAEKGEVLLLKEAPRGTRYVYRNYGKELQDALETTKKGREKRIALKAELRALLGEALELSFTSSNALGKKISVSVKGQEPLQRAQKRASTKEEMEEKIRELGNTSFALEEIVSHVEKDVFVPLSLLKEIKRQAIEAFEKELLDSYKRKVGKEWKVENQKLEEAKTLDFYFIVSKEEQREYLEQEGIEYIFTRSFDIVKEKEMDKIPLDNPYAANLYQILEGDKTRPSISAWNLNISNIYSFLQLEACENLSVISLSPEMSFQKMENLGNPKQKKAILAYSTLRGMYIDLDLSQSGRKIRNAEGDVFTLSQNALGHSELYLSKPLNILSEQERVKKLGIEVMIVELHEETVEEIQEILEQIKTKKGKYQPYNYERGVY